MTSTQHDGSVIRHGDATISRVQEPGIARHQSRLHAKLCAASKHIECRYDSAEDISLLSSKRPKRHRPLNDPYAGSSKVGAPLRRGQSDINYILGRLCGHLPWECNCDYCCIVTKLLAQF